MSDKNENVWIVTYNGNRKFYNTKAEAEEFCKSYCGPAECVISKATVIIDQE